MFQAVARKTGVERDFEDLRALLDQINANKGLIEDYASGKLFERSLAEFESGGHNVSDNVAEAFSVSLNEETGEGREAITALQEEIKRANLTFGLIDRALAKTGDIYDRVSDFYDDLSSSEEVYRYTAEYLTGTTVYSTREASLDMDSLLVWLDDMRQHLETLKNLPAYHQTFNPDIVQNLMASAWVYTVKKGQTLEDIAREIYGDADRAVRIAEYNGINPDNIEAGIWDGMALVIPVDFASNDRLREYNFVLDGNSGVRALGRGLPNELTVTAGGLNLIDYTDNLAQSIFNRLGTPAGELRESPLYGSRIVAMIGRAAPAVQSKLIEVEVGRALSQDPRIESVEKVKAVKWGDQLEITITVRAINNITVKELTHHLTV